MLICNEQIFNKRPGQAQMKPNHRFAYQWLDNVKLNKSAKLNISCGSRIMSIFTNLSQNGHTDGHTHIEITVQTQGSCKSIVQIQASCKTQSDYSANPMVGQF